MMRAYAQTFDSASRVRDRLIAEHVDMAQRIARKIARRVPSAASSEDDLIGAAYFGLTQAAERYDTTRAEPFVAFAEKRIRGAVYDELRRGDILPRRVRTKSRDLQNTMVALRHRFGREPEDEEIAAELGVSLETYQAELEQLAHTPVFETAYDETVGSPPANDTSVSFTDATERRDLVQKVVASMKRLPERDGLLLSLYYIEDLEYREIAKVFGVSESRVCQLHARAILRLRALLAEGVES